ncbi:PH domain-containing protein [Desulforudis sp. 1088]|uniref:PH domain-containing protein n=1 Tax=unclassified Candidatus Desulforudis TaxID=2635950 RepID=UPI003CE5113B
MPSGWIRVYATSWKNGMVVLETEREPYFLSPAEPQRFCDALRTRLCGYKIVCGGKVKTVANLNATLLAQIFHFVLLLALTVGLALAILYFLTRRKSSRNCSQDTSPTMARQEENPERLVCLRCSAELERLGVEKFRIGGATGLVKLVFDEWTEPGEDVLPLEVWVCPGCRRVEFRFAGRD